MASNRVSAVVARLLKGLGLRGDSSADQPGVSPTAVGKLWWLTDVPAFIDERLVDKLYNAIVRPEFILLQSSEKSARTSSDALTGELETSAGLSIPAFFSIGSKARATAASTAALTREEQVTKQFVHSAERRLQEIISVYAKSYPDRMLFDEPGKSTLTTFAGRRKSWNNAERLLDKPGPRPIIFVDLAPRAPILPFAGGSQSGKPVVLIDVVVERLRQQKKPIPAYEKNSAPDAADKSHDYWNALLKGYENWVAIEVINDEFGEGERLEWIDFRMKLSARDKPVHLHCRPAGTLPTGDFAYHLVRRGFKVGLRLVGQLKKGGYVNVLAHYQR